jgi:predicted lipoprotein with Yx(FWY)xxD motif
MLMDGLLIGKDGVIYNSMYEPGEEMVQYFVDENGRTLYIFINDTFEKNNFTQEDFSNNAVWPVYEVELQAVASTLDKALFGSIDVFGHQQLTYKGWPLYYFGGDSIRGNTTGVSVPGPGVWPVAVQDLETAPNATSVNNPGTESGIQIYPNPATQFLNITSEVNIESVSLINLVGATLRTISDIRSSNYVLSLEGIKPGVYFVKVRSSDNKQQTRKLIKR